MKSLKDKIIDVLYQHKRVFSISYTSEDFEWTIDALFSLMDRELQKVTPKKSILLKIDHHKRVLKTLKIPKVIVENPAYIQSLPMSKEAIELAKKQIEENEKYLKFQKKHS